MKNRASKCHQQFWERKLNMNFMLYNGSNLFNFYLILLKNDEHFQWMVIGQSLGMYYSAFVHYSGFVDFVSDFSIPWLHFHILIFLFRCCYNCYCSCCCSCCRCCAEVNVDAFFFAGTQTENTKRSIYVLFACVYLYMRMK